jgi:hypothetical protein
VRSELFERVLERAFEVAVRGGRHCIQEDRSAVNQWVAKNS